MALPAEDNPVQQIPERSAGVVKNDVVDIAGTDTQHRLQQLDNDQRNDEAERKAKKCAAAPEQERQQHSERNEHSNISAQIDEHDGKRNGVKINKIMADRAKRMQVVTELVRMNGPPESDKHHVQHAGRIQEECGGGP